MKKTHLIIGAAAAGVSCATTLRRLSPDDTIIIVSDEKETPYNKCFLADVASGIKTPESVYILTSERAAQLAVDVRLGVRAHAIHASAQKVVFENGTTISYDTLLIAMGTTPRLPALPGFEGEGVFTFHRLSDVEKILAYKEHHAAQHAIVMGAGLSGLECADALKARGMDVVVIDRNDRVLKATVDEKASRIIEYRLRNQGIQFLPKTEISQIVRPVDRPAQILLSSGEVLAADLIVCAIGLIPHTSFIQRSGLEADSQGIIVNLSMATNLPHVFAAGDCVSIPNTILAKRVRSATWPDAMQQGMVAAHSMLGIEKPYLGTCPVVSSSFFGLKFASCGEVQEGGTLLSVNDDQYEKVIVVDDQIRGFLLLGDTHRLALLRRALLTGQPFSSLSL